MDNQPRHFVWHYHRGIQFVLILLLIINLVVTVFIVRGFTLLGTTSRGLARIAGISLVAAVLFSVFSMALALQMALTCVLVVLAYPCRPSTRVVKTLLIAAPIMSYCVAIAVHIPELRERMSLRRKYPLESLAPRLKYEEQAILAANASGAIVSLAADVQERMQHSELQGLNLRGFLLKELHEELTDEFVLARGFGPVRMLSARQHRVVLPNLPPIPFEPAPPQTTLRFNANGSVNQSADRTLSDPSLAEADLMRMHESSYTDFLNPLRTGYVRDREHTAGFEPHRFYQMPGTESVDWFPNRFTASPTRSLPSPPPREEWRKNWAIVRIELIGILSHERPVAYVSEHLPQLNELASYPIRELTGFEQSALNQLQRSTDLVIDDHSDRIRMVGSLRANRDCQKCHLAQRGELLGALTYEMLPE